MDFTERRKRLRRYLQGSECIRPASVFDPISARIAGALGFEVGMLGGSIASAVVLAAPDLAVLTLTELAGQVQRITRVSDISMIVDADHGYGNALSVMRTVQELENAGVSGMTIEDTVLPATFGKTKDELISVEEMTAKLRAAVDARQDSQTVLLGRTHALAVTSLEDAVERAEAMSQTGVDALFLMGARRVEQLEAVRKVTDLPFMLGTTPAAMDNATLASYGVRIALRGHLSFGAAVKAVYDSLKHQADGGGPEGAPVQPSAEETAVALGSEQFARWQREYLA